jgi:hypothetical protein
MDISASVLIVGGIIVFVMIIIYVVALVVGMKSIFKGSGAPISMVQMLLSTVHVTTQHLLGVLIIILLCLLMISKIITSEAGLPLLSAVAGYLLAKTFKDVNISPTKKSNGQTNKDKNI